MSDASSPARLVPFGTQYRASGMLLHVTSLPSPYGIGDIGPAVFAMVDRLQAAGQGYARAKGTHLIGDLPFFVSPDSSDVWANPELFLLDERHRLRFVAGVPPDYFSAQGQLWGNPIYD